MARPTFPWMKRCRWMALAGTASIQPAWATVRLRPIVRAGSPCSREESQSGWISRKESTKGIARLGPPQDLGPHIFGRRYR